MFDALIKSEVVEPPDSNGVAAAQLDGNGESGETIGNNAKAVGTGECSPDMESHTSRLLSLLNELRSFADQACEAALTEARCADRVEETMEAEIEALQDQVKEKEQSLQARDRDLERLQEASNAKFAELEGRVQDQETQLESREIQLQQLVSERDGLVGRLREAELGAEQAKAWAQQRTEQMEAEFANLRGQLAKREESLGERELALRRYEEDLRTSTQNLQLRLQETETKLANRERELRQKESLIDAAAIRETEIGRFIERLSSECEKLSAELCEKRLLIAGLQDNARHSANGGKVWKKILGLAHAGASKSV